MFSKPLQPAAVLLGALVAVSSAVKPLEVRGQDFVTAATGERFVMVGADYQPGGQAGYDPSSGRDPLSDGEICLRDAILMQRLGVNTIRAYNIDPKLNHDACASIFNAAGIYMLIDVNSPLGGESIDRSAPWTSYHVGYLNRTFGVVEGFKDYPNTLGFFAANEVMNDVATSEFNPPYIRVVQRDLRKYIAKHAPRKIPVGYSAADVRDILKDTWQYFQCNIDDADDMSRSEFFGLNSYSWCGSEATFESAGYNKLADMFAQSSIPVFFSEYGCNEVKPRTFDEVPSLYGSKMTALSGGLVYEYSQEESDYGLVVINDNKTITLRVDYKNLQGQLNKVKLSDVTSKDTSKTFKAPACDKKLIDERIFSKNFTLPVPPPGVEDVINNGLSNPTKGKLIPVTATKMPVDVYDLNGSKITGLELKLLSNDGVNAPSGQTTGGTPTGSAPSSSTTAKKNGAAMTGPASLLASICIGAVALAALY